YIYDNVDGSFQTFDYQNTTIAYSPSVIASSEFNYTAGKLGIGLISKYVGKQYLDNTTSHSRSLEAFFVNDLRFTYQTALLGSKNVGLNFLVNNIFSLEYESNGYTFPDMNRGTIDRYNYYYPQATRNFLLSLNLKF